LQKQKNNQLKIIYKSAVKNLRVFSTALSSLTGDPMQILEPQKFASWNEPIEMLYACHGKVKRFCRQLTILPDYLAKNGCNQAVKNDVQQILNYFNQSAPLHHDDEEKDFFPLLVKYVPEAQKDIDELERQHVTLHDSWTKLSEQLQALLKDERENIDVTLINHFVSSYDKHIALEEPLFELGKQHLSELELREIGDIMSARRRVQA
jgi:putative Hemerythrin HHE cation binding domain subfamily protein